MRPYARQANVDLRLEIAEGASALVIKGDRSRLSQIFCNILHNAIKFSPAGGYVKVSCDARDSAAIVRFADQGEGIPAEFLPHVLSAFDRQMVHALALTEDLVWGSHWLRASSKPTADN